MSRRGYDRRQQCAQEGCREVSITNYEFKRDWDDAVQREKGRPPWKCLRHDNPDVVLAVDNPECVGVMVCQQEKYGRFWNDGERNHSGFQHGPGFMTWAEDFPPGTRLIITARIELPDDYTPPPAPPESPPPSIARFATNTVDLDG